MTAGESASQWLDCAVWSTSSLATVLCFEDPRLEASFESAWRAQKLSTHDQLNFWVSSVLTIAATAVQAFVYQLTPTAWTALVLHVAVFVLHGFFLFCLPRQRYLAHRARILVFFHLNYMAVIAIGLHHLPPLRPPESQGDLLRVAVVSSASCALVWLAIGMPLKLAYHVWLQAASLLLAFVAFDAPLCDCLLSTDDGRRWLQELWLQIHAALGGQLLQGRVGGASLAAAGGEGSTCGVDMELAGGADTGSCSNVAPAMQLPMSERQACLSFVVYIQVLVGYMLPLYLLYLQESRARRQFLEHIQAAQSPTGSEPDAAAASSSARSNGVVPIRQQHAARAPQPKQWHNALWDILVMRLLEAAALGATGVVLWHCASLAVLSLG